MYQYALIARTSGRVITTTSAHATEFSWVESQKKTKSATKNTYQDWDSMQLIALMVKHNLYHVPKKFLKEEFSFIKLDGKKAVKVGLGSNWKAAWKKFSADFDKK